MCSMWRQWYLAGVTILTLSSLATASSDEGTAEQASHFQRDRDSYVKKSLSRSERRKSGPDLRFDNGHQANGDCEVYVAPSSIPNGGLGMYTATAFHAGETFPFPEIGIMVPSTGDDKRTLVKQYPWAATVLTHGTAEVLRGEALVPGLGMLANSHLGLINARHSDLWKIRPHLDGTDSLPAHAARSSLPTDAGRGASSPHVRVLFEAQASIHPGEELFVSYGDAWFRARESLLGVVPGSDQFDKADTMLLDFYKRTQRTAGYNNPAIRKEEYALLRQQVLQDQDDPRLWAAFPRDVEDVPNAIELGTARFSAPDSIRSLEWLERNGACIDNLAAGTSDIPQAGQGAFATRFVPKGGRIAATPLLTLDRKHLMISDNYADNDNDKQHYQLLLNYCYGHKDSSLLLFPYAPTVNFINHGSSYHHNHHRMANAKLQWSDTSFHEHEWLDDSLHDIKSRLKTGLVLDIVATKDIHRGEEVLLDYGRDWENAWRHHVHKWSSLPTPHNNYTNITQRLGIQTSHELNQQTDSVVRTVMEQEKNPYPDHITTRCLFSKANDTHTQLNATNENNHTNNTTQTNKYSCQQRWTLTFESDQLHTCLILERQSIQGLDWYTAHVHYVDKSTQQTHVCEVQYIPRYAIRFVEEVYSKDQYARGTFRKEIGLEGILPDQWLDLKEEGTKDLE